MAHAKPCPTCNGENLHRDERHDAHYCVDCVVWTEKQCSDPTCEFCVGRPERPTPQPKQA